MINERKSQASLPCSSAVQFMKLCNLLWFVWFHYLPKKKLLFMFFKIRQVKKWINNTDGLLCAVPGTDIRPQLKGWKFSFSNLIEISPQKVFHIIAWQKLTARWWNLKYHLGIQRQSICSCSCHWPKIWKACSYSHWRWHKWQFGYYIPCCQKGLFHHRNFSLGPETSSGTCISSAGTGVYI